MRRQTAAFLSEAVPDSKRVHRRFHGLPDLENTQVCPGLQIRRAERSLFSVSLFAPCFSASDAARAPILKGVRPSVLSADGRTPFSLQQT